MGWIIGNIKFFFNDPGRHRARPYARCEAVCDRTAVQNIGKVLPLSGGHGRRASRPMPFQDAVHTVFLPVSQPYGYLGTMYFEDVGNLRGGLAFHVENNRMESSCNAICSLTERLFAECDKFLNLFGSSVNLDRSHTHGTSFARMVPLYPMSLYLCKVI